MVNPILVELTRGNIIENIHRGSISVVDADGKAVFSLGEIEKPVYPRSAMKLIQALPLVESGAAHAFGFGNRELSMACSSHSSEVRHVEIAGAMISAAGLAVEDLECGAHWPLIGKAGLKAKIELAKSGKEPTALHNNCSGKHAGFLCCAKHAGMKIEGYIDPKHELQREIVSAMEDVCGEAIPGEQCGFDGCSAPTMAASLKGLAFGFAKLGAGVGLRPQRAKAASQLMNACVAEPWLMAGTGRFCTRIMEIGAGRIFAKVGADGVYTAAIPEMGIGIALKVDDGSEHACEMMLAAVLNRLFANDPDIGAQISALTIRPIKNWNGIQTGTMRSMPI